MRFKIEFECSSEFYNRNIYPEGIQEPAARALERAAIAIRRQGPDDVLTFPIRDADGTRIGRAEWIDE